MFSKQRIPVVAVAVAVFLLIGWQGLRAKTNTESSDIYQYLRLFSDVLNIVQDNYVEKTDSKKLMYGAINGMLRE